jgi:hypothetical protein
LQEEESDAPESTNEVAVWPSWSGYLQLAWHVLRDDRYYGAMGGMGRIYYTALSRYASDHDIELEPFVTFMHAMDNVYLEYESEKAKQEAAAAANK